MDALITHSKIVYFGMPIFGRPSVLQKGYGVFFRESDMKVWYSVLL
jgi:hypothetical protein